LENKQIYKKAEIDSLVNKLEMAKAAYTKAKAKDELWSQSSNLLREVAINCQEDTRNKIANILTRFYQYVFENTDTVEIVVETKRGVPSASIWIRTTKGGEEILLNPEHDDGGGKVDVISLGLRVAGLLLATPSLNKVLILDEPLKALSTTTTSVKPYRRRTAEFLSQISKELGIQFIVVTHDAEFVEVADRSFTFTLDENGYTKVTTQDKLC
jgi:DNA repair exonuclease SbcCD ATPase subunit